MNGFPAVFVTDTVPVGHPKPGIVGLLRYCVALQVLLFGVSVMSAVLKSPPPVQAQASETIAKGRAIAPVKPTDHVRLLVLRLLMLRSFISSPFVD